MGFHLLHEWMLDSCWPTILKLTLQDRGTHLSTLNPDSAGETDNHYLWAETEIVDRKSKQVDLIISEWMGFHLLHESMLNPCRLTILKLTFCFRGTHLSTLDANTAGRPDNLGVDGLSPPPRIDARLMLADYSKVDTPGLRFTSVNFGRQHGRWT